MASRISCRVFAYLPVVILLAAVTANGVYFAATVRAPTLGLAIACRHFRGLGP